MIDIKSLVALHNENLDWSLVEEYFKLFDMEDLYKRIKREYNENF